MVYREDKYGNKISVLGYGCMRFTKNAGAIDMDKAEKELMAAPCPQPFTEGARSAASILFIF